MLRINTANVGSLLISSKIPSTDFAINPYVGCPHRCEYCYAEFMTRFSGHIGERWGEFIDIKLPRKPINRKKLAGKSVLIGTATDAYNRLEAKYRITRGVLEELLNTDASVTILTKSDLILRDMDLLKRMSGVTAAFSIVSLDERFRSVMEPGAPQFERRVGALRQLSENGIATAIFMAPIFPGITDYRNIISHTRNFAAQYWFDTLNLRGGYKPRVMRLIERHYPALTPLYRQIYVQQDRRFWIDLKEEIDDYCHGLGLDFANFFRREQIKNIL